MKDEELVHTILEVVKNNQFINEKGSRGLLLNKKNKNTVLSTLFELDVSAIYTSVSRISPPGYVGYSITDIFKELLKNSNGNLKEAERSVIILDEFEKLRITDLRTLNFVEDYRKNELRSYYQNIFLSYLNGTVVPLEYNDSIYFFDTSKLTFICLGDFKYLRDYYNSSIDFFNEGYKVEFGDYLNLTYVHSKDNYNVIK